MEDIEDIKNYFKYVSPVGIFVIQYDYNESKWSLGINNTVHGLYSTPIAAADDVFCQTTGYYEWDSFDTIKIITPTDVYQWEKYKR